jgi:hypothetical protein
MEGVLMRRWIHVSGAFLSPEKIGMLQRFMEILVRELFVLIAGGELLARRPGGGGGSRQSASEAEAEEEEATKKGSWERTGQVGERRTGQVGQRRPLLYTVPELYLSGMMTNADAC